MLVVLLIVVGGSLDGGGGFWKENEAVSDSPENMDTGRWKRKVTLDPVLVNPLLMFTKKINYNI